MESIKPAGSHLLAVKHKGVANKIKLTSMMTNFVNRAYKVISPSDDVVFEFNTPQNKDGVLSSYAYLWVNNLEVFHLLQGKNLDGSSRKEIVYKDNFPDIDEEKDIEEMFLVSSISNWGNSLDDEAPEEVILAPLVKLIEYKLEESEHEMYKKQVIFESKGVITAPIDFNIKFKPEFTLPYYNKLDCFVLVGIPQGRNTYRFTESEVSAKFSRYSTIKEDNITIQGNKMNVTYPLIAFNDKKVYIRYSRGSVDAKCAFYMEKRCQIDDRVYMFLEGTIEDVSDMENIVLNKSKFTSSRGGNNDRGGSVFRGRGSFKTYDTRGGRGGKAMEMSPKSRVINDEGGKRGKGRGGSDSKRGSSRSQETRGGNRYDILL